jgi:hypothetical protein
MIKMKNILAENMLRFGVKNLKEADTKIISESLLLEQTQQVTAALKSLNDALKAKPTTVGTYAKVYPIVSIRWTNNATPPKGGDGSALGKELPIEIGTSGFPGNLPAGSKMPIAITIGAGVIDDSKTSAIYQKFLRESVTNWKKQYTFDYYRGDNPGGDTKFSQLAMTVPKAVPQLVATINKFYVYDSSTSTWWGTRGVDASPSGTSQDFVTQFTTLLYAFTGYPYRPISA